MPGELQQIRDMQPIGNAFANRFKEFTFGSPELDMLYQWQARKAGLRFGPETRLAPHILTDSTQVRTDDPLHVGIPLSLSATTPTAQLRWYFQDAAFVRRLTAVVTGLRLTAAGQPDQLFENSIIPGDYIYAQLKRDGSGDVFQTNFMPLSEFTGSGSHAYFFNLVPVVEKAGSLLMELTLFPPNGQALQNPPFVDHCGMVTVSIHTERFTPFGV